MKRNAFGQLFGTAHPGLRFAGDGDGSGGGKEYTPPATQEEFDRIITERAARAERQAREDERTKFADYDSVKTDAEKYRAAQAAADKAKGKTDDDTPKGVSEDDVDERITNALAARDLELGLERVNDQLDKALEGRTFAASQVLGLDRKQFVKDGKFADTEAIKEWVEKNSTEIEKAEPRRRQIPGQGDRDSNASGGSVQSGRDIYNDQKPKSRKD